MDVSNIVTQVDTAPSLVQVLAAVPGGFDVPVNGGDELYTLLASLVSNRVFPLTVRDDEALPHIIYTQIGTDSLELEGYRLTQTDRYVLTMRTDTHAALKTLITSIVTTIRTSSYAIDLIDMELQHEAEYTTDGAFRADLEIDFTYLVDAAGGPSSALSTELPLALVYPVGRVADESIADNLIMQQVVNEYAIVIATIDNDMPTLLDEVQGVLLGYQQGAGFHDIEYVSGSNLGGVGTMQLWREIYSDYEYMRET